MSEKRENFLKSLKPDDGNRIFAAMNTSGRTREAYGKAEQEQKAAQERDNQAKEDIRNWTLSADAAMVESREAKDALARANIKLREAQKDIDDSKASVR